MFPGIFPVVLSLDVTTMMFIDVGYSTQEKYQENDDEKLHEDMA